jgi:hypothetical protein
MNNKTIKKKKNQQEKKKRNSLTWTSWHTPIIPGLRRLRQNHREFQATLSPKKKKKKVKNKLIGSHYVTQAGPEFLSLNDPSASAS